MTRHHWLACFTMFLAEKIHKGTPSEKKDGKNTQTWCGNSQQPKTCKLQNNNPLKKHKYSIGVRCGNGKRNWETLKKARGSSFLLKMLWSHTLVHQRWSASRWLQVSQIHLIVDSHLLSRFRWQQGWLILWLISSEREPSSVSKTHSPRQKLSFHGNMETKVGFRSIHWWGGLHALEFVWALSIRVSLVKLRSSDIDGTLVGTDNELFPMSDQKQRRRRRNNQGKDEKEVALSALVYTHLAWQYALITSFLLLLLLTYLHYEKETSINETSKETTHHQDHYSFPKCHLPIIFSHTYLVDIQITIGCCTYVQCDKNTWIGPKEGCCLPS